MDNRKKGNKGEEVACKFIKKIGFDVIGRNYQKKWGEIDIIATKSNKVHFFEVKSVTTAFEEEFSNSHRPEDNVHGLKVKHIRRMIETFLEESGRGLEAEFHFHVLCVYMNMKTRRARVRMIENIIL
ncbi:MAG: hypothetical protein A3B11_00440 [Candidatus Taylorbacteria bacterium RIFCSPLOWO2_01_FULL_44_26]|uniref:UPF0102 protein A3D50_00350 n=2 Tax=Candidatus Tayloriibacteriota TaxID=1817919 RepID=A0A1G2MLC1_9BACT|nr:MAG: hypothetical protein A3D50_00350 [Candidatus Taylorbacteria bacterium RIFCSPHIGHO2_02_FULL_44_12]OHA31154.1 MAG: hypothetical protein A3B11_00440 [Candidatus Taylorbacteria bacterium RIFCSPLOWO2_01_FULL_44_26]